jgi:molybdate transport system substrate-binding protein
MRLYGVVAALTFALGLAASTDAAEVKVAVAANFAGVLDKLATAFRESTGDELVISAGATGGLYNQIVQGAPFEVFLAADDKRPALAVEEGYAVEGTVFTYAAGRVVLYSPTIDVTDGEAVLEASDFAYISIADPKAAPYGAAAEEALRALGFADLLRPKIVTGENISQTILFVESGSADLGFVALSQVLGKPANAVWMVPPALYSPILQDAVLLKAGETNPAATAFLAFLKSEEAAVIISRFGYSTDVR